MKRISILFITTAIFLSFMLSSCAAPNVDEDLAPQIPDESEVYFESIFDVKIEDVQEAQEEEEKEETQDIQIENDNIENIQEEAQELITEPLKFLIDKDLTEDDIEYLMPYTDVEIWVLEENINISLLSQLVNLEKLQIFGDGGFPSMVYPPLQFYISDFLFLSGMGLKELRLDCGEFELDLGKISLECLEKLEIARAKIITEHEIESLPALKELNIWASEIKTINAFCLLNLNILWFYSCKIEVKNINRINEITTLENLQFSFIDNYVELDTLSNLLNLKYLSMHRTKINFNIEIIYELTWLEGLSISYSIITEEQMEKYIELNPKCIAVISPL